MKNSTVSKPSTSPFHAGEQEMQQRNGVREATEAFGSRVIRPFMPEQHRLFFAQLPFLVVGHVDHQGAPWSSLLPGQPGFIQSPDNTTLRVDAVPHPHDSLTPAKQQPVGLLGIALPTRRRNRMNGRVLDADASGFSVHVDQSYGNCPKYIHQRETRYVGHPIASEPDQHASQFSVLDKEAQDLIRQADTFFVASYAPAKDRPEIEGVDVSHRGGQPGFVRLEDNELLIPDFAGNNIFNTLGNFLLNPKAGLTFADFENGDLLQLTGAVEVLAETQGNNNSPFADFNGAERGWRFTVSHGRWLRGALPLAFAQGEPSPFNAATDTWPKQ